MKEHKPPQPWPLLRSESGPELPLFHVRYHWMMNPRNHLELKRLVLECPDWVNVVAITPEEKIVMVRQFRFGVNKITCEIPGGMVDSGEDSRQAAMRELREETGFTSVEWQYLGAVEPNPAIQNNLCHHWLARNVRKTHRASLDDGEDLQVSCLSLEEIQHEIKTGRLLHALALSALSRVFDLRSGLIGKDEG